MMTPGTSHWNDRGLSLLEVLLATMILAIGLLGIMSAFPTSYSTVVASGGNSKATAYAQQKLEDLKNQPFTPGPINGNDTLENGEYARTWTIGLIAGPALPNRLARITVTVSWGGRGSRPQTVTLETMRAE